MGRHSRKGHWFDNAHRDNPAMKLHACVNGKMQRRRKPSPFVKAAAVIILIGIAAIIVIAAIL